MKTVTKIVTPTGLLFGVFLILSLFGTTCWAAEGEGGWRSTYDLIMMWLNFAILAFLLIRFGKKPIKGFFKDQKESIARAIENVEAEKAALTEQVKQALQSLEETDVRFNAIKEKIVAEGESKKKAIIEDARRESQLMIDQAHFWINRQIAHARQRLKSEVIDEAIELTLNRLPQSITPEDNQKLIHNYLGRLEEFSKAAQ
jgi:F-type H+-transporting ATPase subunit b